VELPSGVVEKVEEGRAEEGREGVLGVVEAGA